MPNKPPGTTCNHAHTVETSRTGDWPWPTTDADILRSTWDEQQKLQYISELNTKLVTLSYT